MLTFVLLLTAGVLAAAFASAAEVVLYAVSEPQIESMNAEDRRGARSLAALRSEPVRTLVMLWLIRLGATAVAVLSAWRVAAAAFGPDPIVSAGAVLVALVLLLAGEMLAHTIPLRRVEPFSRAAAVPLRAVSRLLFPIAWPVGLALRVMAPRIEDVLPRITDRELRDLLGPGNGEPTIEEHERLLIQRALLLDQTRAYDVMTPRVDIFAWQQDLTLAEITPQLRAVRYSRVPIFGDNIDDITGILYVRDAYQALISGQRDVKLHVLAREPFFVPGSVTLDALLLDFQTRRAQLGIVIDEYGGVDGLITMEDILEELVGEIVDESDVAEDRIVRLGRTEVLVHGTADLREINHFFNTTFPLLEHRSLNGYLLEELGEVPKPGEEIEREGVLIEVLDATDTQVVRARLTRRPARGDAPGLEGAQEAAGPRTAEEPAGARPDEAPGPERAERSDGGRESEHSEASERSEQADTAEEPSIETLSRHSEG